MKRTILLPAIVPLCLLLNGCGGPYAGGAVMGEGYRAIIEAGIDKSKCWSYEPNTYEPPTRKLDRTAVVMPFIDGRKPKYEYHALNCFIPLFLYSTNEYEPPELHSDVNFLQGAHGSSTVADSRLEFRPTEDFAKALVEELQAGAVFREVTFGTGAVAGDYVISGKVLDTTMQESLYGYGVSLFAIFMWGFGLPAGSYTNDVSLELTCTDTRSGAIVLSKVYTAPEYWMIYWMYRQPNFCNYGEMVQSLYKLFVEELSARLQEQNTARGEHG